jgi:hypothetical protein
VLSFTPAHRRCFPDLPLGFCGLSAGSQLRPGPRVPTGSELLRLLERLVQQEDSWIDSADPTPASVPSQEV